VTDDKQTTDHTAKKWVAIGEIACARAISLRRYIIKDTFMLRL